MLQLMAKKMKKSKKGFTLIELIVVIAILGILAAILIPRFSGFTGRAQEAQAVVTAKQIATAYDSLVAEGKTWITGTTATTGRFLTSDVITLAGTPTDGSLGTTMDANGAFVWTVTATGKKAGRVYDATTGLSPVQVIP